VDSASWKEWKKQYSAISHTDNPCINNKSGFENAVTRGNLCSIHFWLIVEAVKIYSEMATLQCAAISDRAET
jgi:hypothetical protein